MLERLERVRHDDEAVKKIGCEIAAEMCNRILSDTSSSLDNSTSNVHGFHFYTLNRCELSYAICHMLGVRAQNG